ncbi:MAG TPA: glutaminase A [Phycisphaerae bacterium]|nr:glutaminase A [Phycisphaerales bacterium]HRX86696.1 glutaminase A [Phycisphaerae bacterium]
MAVEQHHPTYAITESDVNIRILSTINELHLRYRDLDEGTVAGYIPELSKVDPDLFAISVVTTDGKLYSVGDDEHAFTLQSLANPFIFGMVLDELGRERVRQFVGVEPTGNPFNAIVLDRQTNRPMNPMVNAGAIAVTGLVPGNDPTDRLNRMLAALGRYMGGAPQVDIEVFMSEKSTGDRNRSIAYLMRNFGTLTRDINEVLDQYFQQCAVSVNCRNLACMAATMAAGGVNPHTGERAISRAALRDVLTIMYTCGLYESSGRWVHTVGIPAKSGVGGGLMAVVPGRMGIAIFSPRLDSQGNSVRGVRVCTDLARQLNLHLFVAGGDTAPAVAPIDQPPGTDDTSIAQRT